MEITMNDPKVNDSSPISPAAARLKGALRTMVDFDCPSCEASALAQVVATDHISCTNCSARRPFRRSAAYVITGSPGTGKSSVGRALAAHQRSQLVVLDTDLTARPDHDTSEQAWLDFIDTWLRTAVGIGQGGHRPVLVGYSTPEQWEQQPLRHFLGPITHIALVCSSQELAKRLSRRNWIASHERDSLIALNQKFRGRGDVTLIETDHQPPDAVADHILGILDQVRPPTEPAR
jgi:gluconate kinase